MNRKSPKNERAPKATAPSLSIPAAPGRAWTAAGVSVLLALAVWIVFGQTRHFAFVQLDDNNYVYENPYVTAGLTWESVRWAFTHAYAHNWHPLIWISLMLDHQLYGLDPAGYHVTNVILHAATAVLLFLGVRRLTGFLWRSAFIAAVFAVHPLHVESVAWVTERKDVLSGLFFSLTLLGYANYVVRLKVRASAAKFFYALTLLFFALGLMSKPMLVTVPLVLWLIDYWPLNRLQPAATEPSWRIGSWRIPRRVLVEKVPMLGLAAISSIITLFAQRDVMQPIKSLPLGLRFENAAVSCAAYLRQMLLPIDLVVFYPPPEHGFPWWKLAVTATVLAGITALAFVLRSRRPYLLVGWLWYVVMLVPVIGIVQVGTQARADRYTYLPHIGLYLLITWLMAEIWIRHRRLLATAAVATVLACLGCAWCQAGYWKNSETLWRHALTYPGNDEVPGCHDSLGAALDTSGRLDEAIVEYQRAVALSPDFASAHNNLGFALLRRNRVAEAIAEFQKAVEYNPTLLVARGNFGNALLRGGREREAVEQFEAALKLNPQFASALNSLAWVLATSSDASLRNGPRAVELAQQINEITGGNVAECLDTLAAAYAEAGNFPEAIQTAERAVELAKARGNEPFIADMEAHLKLYQAGQPLRQASAVAR
jgi:tetratricopeptide (TPR) repeat protein